MPPRTKISKNEILFAATEMLRNGEEINARALAKKAGCSTQPIFSNYFSMDDLKKDLIAKANEVYQSYLLKAFQDESMPKYKASGMGYVRFAREEPKLFALLFMRDRRSEVLPTETEAVKEVEPIIKIIMKNLDVDEEIATKFHTSMWVFVHGIATMIATGYLEWDEETVSRALSDEYAAKRRSLLDNKN